MKLSDIKRVLKASNKIAFELPNGELVPSHFHVTEVGLVHKHFIDCGGTIRKEEKVNFQLWNANDYDHRLHPEKLLHIIELSERKLSIPDIEVEVEYQGDTIGRYALDLKNEHFYLEPLATTCLAQDACGIPKEKPKVRLADLQSQNQCAPGSNCC